MTRKNRTNEELKKISKDLYYEYLMFCYSIQTLPKDFVRNDEKLKNSIIEVFAIHTRNLLMFFFDEKPRDDDVVANDFFPEYNEWNIIKEKNEDNDLIEKISKRVNKEVAHLTYKRLEVKEEEKSWGNIINITSKLFNKLFNEFLSSVSNDKLGDNFLVLKEQLQRK